MTGLWQRRATYALFLCASAAYLVWRAAATYNDESPLWWWTFFLLEAYATCCAAFFYLLVLERSQRTPLPAPRGLRVDVLICTYNEPLALVRQTVRRALALEYPHQTYLCDDGDRAEARALARELGCGYFARGKNVDYKAGNLNHALSHTHGDFVVVLDADHLLRPDFLDRLLGYFDDPDVALVQTPQVFYNVDSFQHHFVARHLRLWHEGAIFHHAIQPGADRFNAAFFVGTGAILRRSALEAVGGIATGTVTEDCHTSLRLHAAGYRSAYHDEPLGYLQAPQSLLQYLTQRLRWGQGSMQILRQQSPLTLRGLSVVQRLTYLNALSSFAQSAVHLAYYLAPGAFLLGAAAPLRLRHSWHFAALVAHVAVDLIVFRLMLGRLARPLLGECYKFLNVYCYLKALGGYFRRERLRFEVTTKGRDGRGSLALLTPQLLLLLLNATGFAVGCLRLAQGGALIDLLGVSFATFFSGIFVVVGGTAALFAVQRLAARSEYAFPDSIPALLAGSVRATVVRVHPEAMQLLAPADAPLPAPGARLELQLELGGPALAVSGVVASAQRTLARARGERVAHKAALLKVALDPLGERARDRLFDRLALRAMPHVAARLAAAPQELAPAPGAEPAWFLPVEPNVL